MASESKSALIDAVLASGGISDVTHRKTICALLGRYAFQAGTVDNWQVCTVFKRDSPLVQLLLKFVQAICKQRGVKVIPQGVTSHWVDWYHAPEEKENLLVLSDFSLLVQDPSDQMLWQSMVKAEKVRTIHSKTVLTMATSIVGILGDVRLKQKDKIGSISPRVAVIDFPTTLTEAKIREFDSMLTDDFQANLDYCMQHYWEVKKELNGDGFWRKEEHRTWFRVKI